MWSVKSQVKLADLNPIYVLWRKELKNKRGEVIQRDMLHESGAVAVVAMKMNGDVALIKQFRAPIGKEVWEIPAGRLDDPAKTPLEIAEAELREEADLTAETWEVLVDEWTSPGITDGRVRIYGAYNLTEVEPFERRAEEADIQMVWMPIKEALRMIFNGEITDGHTALGILAARVLQVDRSLPQGLPRPADAPWVLIPEVG